MKKKLKKKWVKALRSGDFKQTSQRLSRKNELGDMSFCCLGVLCEVSSSVKYDDLSDGRYYYKKGDQYNTSEVALSSSMLVAWGIASKEERALIQMNDTEGFNFNAIADYIEKNL